MKKLNSFKALSISFLLFVAITNNVIAQCTIALNSTTSGFATTSATSLTVSHTVSGSNTLLTVRISSRLYDPTSVTWNGSALTKLTTANRGGAQYASIWYLVNPEAGTFNVVVNGSAGFAPVVGISSFTGINQTTPFGTVVSGTFSGTNPSLTVSSAVDELVMDVVNSAAALSAGAGQTEQYNIAGTVYTGTGSTEPGASSVTMSWSGSSPVGAHIAVPLKPCATQTGASCSTAKDVALEMPVTPTESQTQQIQWYKFVAKNNYVTINLLNGIYGTSDKINKIILWGGPCDNLSMISSDTITNTNDSVLSIATYLTEDNTYYLQFQKTNSTTTINYYALFNYTPPSPAAYCEDPAPVCNLITNGGFEINTSLPTGFSSLFLTCEWDAATWGTPDYFSVGGTNGTDVPLNAVGSQLGRNGSNSYAGFVAIEITDPPVQFAWQVWHEYVSQQLPAQMINGGTYQVSFYVSLADYSEFATNSIGAFITTNAVLAASATIIGELSFTPQILQNTSVYIDNVTDWVLITGKYTANGNEEVIVIGNFGSTYTVSPSAPNFVTLGEDLAYYYLDDVSIIYQVPVTVIASPPTICPGSSSTLTASGALTYAWSPSTGLSSTTGTTVTANPSTTITYTVTGTDANGCTGTNTVTVNVIPSPTVTATAAPGTITVPATSQLNATSSGVTYSWNTGATSSTITVSPTVTTTYTVTVTSTTNGCTATATVVVRVVPASCNLTYDYVVPAGGANTSDLITLFGSTITNKNISVLGTLTVNSTVTFSGCNLVMDPDVKINLTTGNLYLLSQTHLYSCTDMWDGIYANGKMVTINTSTFIEDAKQAVNVAQGGYANIQRTIFNKNLIAIEFTANTSGSSPLLLLESVITSREIPYSVTIPGNTGNSTVAQVKANFTSGSPLPAALLKVPYSNRKGCYGVDAFDVNNLTIGYAAATKENYFDNIMCGINLSNTNSVIYNNRFQYLLGHNGINCPAPPPRCFYENGIGVQAIGTAVSGTNTITVGGTGANQANTFTNTYHGISVTYYKTQTIKKNSITNVNTGPFGTIFAPLLNYGSGGITVSTPTSNNVINISNQTLIKNCETGIYVFRASGNGTSSLTINDNGDATNAPTVPCITADASGYCTNGIYINDLIQGTVVPSVWEIKNNVIDKTANCINLLNVKKPTAAPGTFQYEIKINSVTALYTASAINTNGIKAKNCMGVSIASNHTKYQGGTPYLSGNILSYGIFLETSSNMFVKCNKIDDAARSLVFQGLCISSPFSGNNIGIFQNEMNRAQDGFVLKTNGEIGIQGDININNGNKWIAPFANSETFTENTSNANTNSKLFMNDNPEYMPANNKSFPLGAEYSQAFGGLNITPAGFIACSPEAPALIPLTGMERSGGTIDLDKYGEDLERMERDSSQLPVYNDETHWMRKKFVYDELKSKPELISKASLEKFYNATSTNYSKFSEVEENIIGERYKQAGKINNDIIPVNTIEGNQKTINVFILRSLLDPAYLYTEEDKKTTNDIALQCPFSSGYAVYQARNMMMGIENKVIEFADNCDVVSDRAMTNIHKTSKENSSFNLYPNPNNGNMLLDYSIHKDDVGVIKIYDLAGKLVAEYGLNASHKQLQLNNVDLINGIYMYNIIVNDKTVKTDKLVIIKQ